MAELTAPVGKDDAEGYTQGDEYFEDEIEEGLEPEDVQ